MAEQRGDKCPECGEEIENVRVTCPNCGYEYSESDYSNKDEGMEFLAGSNIDDKGEEIVDEGAGAGEAADSEPAQTSAEK